MTVLVIAEFSSNVWPYTPERMQDFIDAAASAGADGCKVQCFEAGHFPISERATKKLVEFPKPMLAEFVEACHAQAMLAGASVFGPRDIAACVNADMDLLKLAGREIDNHALRLACGQTGLSVHRSVTEDRLREFSPLISETWLICISEYPTEMGRAIALAESIPFRHQVGWSSHTRGWADCLVAVERGAVVIEKHLATSRDDLESGWSLQPSEFATMVTELRDAEN